MVHRPSLGQVQPPRDIVGNLQYLGQYPKSIWKIADVIQKRDIDVVHASMSLSFEAALATQKTDASLVWHFNDVAMPWPINRIAAALATMLADEIVVASDGVTNHYFDKVSINPTKLYAPVDIEKFRPERYDCQYLYDELGIEDDTIIIGAVGNVNPIKGHGYLVEAIDRLANKVDDEFTVIVAGGILEGRQDYYNSLLRRRSKLGLDGKIRFLGRRDDIPELLSQLDLFVLPSIAEACPISVLEAMAMKRPIVASDVGGVPEQISDGESGWLVPPKDPDKLSKSIRHAIEHPTERKRRGEAARKTAADRFSLQACANKHEKIYSNVSNILQN